MSRMSNTNNIYPNYLRIVIISKSVTVSCNAHFYLQLLIHRITKKIKKLFLNFAPILQVGLSLARIFKYGLWC